MSLLDNILDEADKIVNHRSEDNDRRYGSFEDCMTRVSKLASIISGKDITVDDAFIIMVSLKLSRESNFHKRDNLVDLVGYVQGWHDYREKLALQEEDTLYDEAHSDERMSKIGRNGNEGLHYEKKAAHYVTEDGIFPFDYFESVTTSQYIEPHHNED